MNIWLVGYMGSGKSSLARHLSTHQHMKLLDIDAAIEGMVGMTIADLWAKHGERYFRVLERQVCLTIKNHGDYVIATGGGLPLNSFSIDEMKKSGHVVFLSADADTLWSRVQSSKATRPLAMNHSSFAARLRSRQDIYECADITLDAKLPLTTLSQRLQALLKVEK